MNIWNGIGNLTRDPQISYIPGDEPRAVCRFTMAINDGYGEQKKTDYIQVVCFGPLAENCEKFIRKGSQVGVSGKIQTGSYEKNGQKYYTTDIIANKVDFLSGNK